MSTLAAISSHPRRLTAWLGLLFAACLAASAANDTVVPRMIAHPGAPVALNAADWLPVAPDSQVSWQPVLAPDTTDIVKATLLAPTSLADYGQRLRGWLVPPTTGDNTFWIAADDSAELWLSSSDAVAGKRRVAVVSGGVGEQEFDQNKAQRSAPIALVAGQR